MEQGAVKTAIHVITTDMDYKMKTDIRQELSSSQAGSNARC